MILIIDNYDSFVYNIVQRLGELGYDSLVVRNDKITIEEIEKMDVSHVILSPGPCTPNESGVCIDIIKKIKKPILGICLGHQCIAQAFGGKVVRADPVHGKADSVNHDGKGIFSGVSNPFVGTRYHSLIVERESLPSCLEVSAWNESQLVMAVWHKTFQVYGIQVHPESILTTEGYKILKNFVGLTGN